MIHALTNPAESTPEDVTNLILAITGLVVALGGLVIALRGHGKATSAQATADSAEAKADTVTELVNGHIADATGPRPAMPPEGPSSA
jgi:hypothetical protein